MSNRIGQNRPFWCVWHSLAVLVQTRHGQGLDNLLRFEHCISDHILSCSNNIRASRAIFEARWGVSVCFGCFGRNGCEQGQGNLLRLEQCSNIAFQTTFFHVRTLFEPQGQSSRLAGAFQAVLAVLDETGANKVKATF